VGEPLQPLEHPLLRTRPRRAATAIRPYQIVNFEAVDNILNMRYLEAVCRPLIDERVDYRLFYEVKSNPSASSSAPSPGRASTSSSPGSRA